MTAAENYHFLMLKLEAVKRFRAEHPDAPEEISNWAMKDISDFQEDLLKKASGRVSTKWIYTHLKNTGTDKLPRIDVLNLLSRYAGVPDWDAFKKAFQYLPDNETTATGSDHAGHLRKKKNRYWLLLAAVLIGTAAVLFILSRHKSGEKTLTLCLQDADFGRPLKPGLASVYVLPDGESPVPVKADSSSCFQISTDKEMVRIIVRGPYFRTDTLVRKLPLEKQTEYLKLKSDDYALLINIFSNSSLTDWEKRRRQLADMLTDDAQIFQVHENSNLGMEMYNKQEFIDKMTMPVSSLRNINVLETRYRGQRICALRFVQQEK